MFCIVKENCFSLTTTGRKLRPAQFFKEPNWPLKTYVIIQHIQIRGTNLALPM